MKLSEPTAPTPRTRACAILADPRILILDEAIPSVDADVVAALIGVVLMIAGIAVSLTLARSGIPLIF